MMRREIGLRDDAQQGHGIGFVRELCEYMRRPYHSIKLIII